MAWIKDFRKAYGLSQFQLAQFAGITRSYLSFLEVQPKLPLSLDTLFQELADEFEKARKETSGNKEFFLPRATEDKIQRLKDQIEKKEAQIGRSRTKLASLERRYDELLVLNRVCLRWAERKKDVDPNLPQKLGQLQSGQRIELRKCGPEICSNIRIVIARLEADVKEAKEEIQKLNDLTKP